MASQFPRGLLYEMRARGIRITPARKVVVSIIERTDGPVRERTVRKMARREGVRVHRATVFRTLALLRDAGLFVRKGSSGVSIGPAPEPPMVDELVLVCDCGTRQSVAASAVNSLKTKLQLTTGFYPRAVRVQANGTCRTCTLRQRPHLPPL